MSIKSEFADSISSKCLPLPAQKYTRLLLAQDLFGLFF